MRRIDAERERCLAAYRSQPSLIEEHFRIEVANRSGGYGQRQVFELVQNAADAIQTGPPELGRVEVVLTEEALYCANSGSAFEPNGVASLLLSHVSGKCGSQIGHFGLGFKSVLAVTESPQVFSRSGSFGFDLSYSETLLRPLRPRGGVPLLRVARPLEPSAEEARDTTLARLMKWATTVVRLPRDGHLRAGVGQQLREFPVEFLLFSPHVRHLVLTDERAGLNRSLAAWPLRDGFVVLRDEKCERTMWRLSRETVAITDLGDEACADADPATFRRGNLPLFWAVPMKSRRSRGSFWAFFPTSYESTLGGILNAPWKTNADRLNLLEGAFNRSLLDRAAALVAGTLPLLVRKQADRGRVVDLLPARGQDALNWGDRHVSQGLERVLPSVAFVPAAGTARRLLAPRDVLVRPGCVHATLLHETLDGAPDIESGPWVHESVEQRERRAKLARLGSREGSVKEWLESVAAPGTPEASRRALVLVSALPPAEAEEARAARMILDTSSSLATASEIFLASGDAPVSSDFRVVHPEVAGDASLADVLAALGVTALGRTQLEQMLQAGGRDWPTLLAAAASMEPEEAAKVLLDCVEGDISGIRVRTLAGSDEPGDSVLLPGGIVPTDDPDDGRFCVDVKFPGQSLPLLKALGLTDVPRSGQKARGRWFEQYQNEARAAFRKDVIERGIQSRPSDDHCVFVGDTSTCHPLDLIRRLSADGRARLVSSLLPCVESERQWVMAHRTQRNYGSLKVDPPLVWLIRKYGYLPTSLGSMHPDGAVGPQLRELDAFMPVAECTEHQARQLGLPQTASEVKTRLWSKALGRAAEAEDTARAGRFYSTAAEHVEAPEVIRCQIGAAPGLRKPETVRVVCTPEAVAAHREAGIPFLELPDPAACRRLGERWGLQEAAADLGYVPSGPEGVLSDMFPELEAREPRLGSERLQPCDELWFETAGPDGTLRSPALVAQQSGVTFFAVQDERSSVVRRLEGAFGLVTDDASAVRPDLLPGARAAGGEEVRQIPGLPEKLVRMLAPEILRTRLPASANRLIEPSAPAAQLAGVVLAVFGVETLKKFAAELRGAGWEAPHVWAGSDAARRFVDSVGFPREFAGFPGTSRLPFVEVDGPVDLKPLHDFQERIVDRMLGFLPHRSGASEAKRGLLSLPTGAGKTRVVVEALIRRIVAGSFRDLIVWIAQSDELCEQAVQSWGQAWRSIGPQHKRLRVSRLWGATNNSVSVADGGAHVVVTTYQTLSRRVDDPSFSWLWDPGCVVVDEAHGSTARSYTTILARFGLTQRETQRPLIGLSATPFRGTNERETQRLVSRYNGYRFDSDLFEDRDPYAVLQERRILARVKHMVLEGVEIALSGEEMARFEEYGELPKEVEARIGRDEVRNERILQSISELPQPWPVLVFAASVEHAHLLAALLTMRGVSARSISAETDVGARRHYVDEFRRGNIRVLTNYNVLASGFDAPAIRALYVTRPVFSPGLYQQMIGRGLRGPRNGGKRDFLLVNVDDNEGMYGHRLAFRTFEGLWQTEASGGPAPPVAGRVEEPEGQFDGEAD